MKVVFVITLFNLLRTSRNFLRHFDAVTTLKADVEISTGQNLLYLRFYTAMVRNNPFTIITMLMLTLKTGIAFYAVVLCR
jgi:hypothetical protein